MERFGEEICMAAEDFSYSSHITPSCFYMLSAENKKKIIPSRSHISIFKIDDEALKIGSGLMAYLEIKELTLFKNHINCEPFF